MRPGLLLLYLHQFLLRVLETFRNVVDWLELRDGVLGHPGYRRVERPNLGFVAEAVLQLAVGGQKAGSVSLKLAVLATKAKLDGEPIALWEDMDRIKKLETLLVEKGRLGQNLKWSICFIIWSAIIHYANILNV